MPGSLVVSVLFCIASLFPSLQSGGQLRDLRGSDFILISDEDETERPTARNSCIHGMYFPNYWLHFYSLDHLHYWPLNLGGRDGTIYIPERLSPRESFLHYDPSKLDLSNLLPRTRLSIPPSLRWCHPVALSGSLGHRQKLAEEAMEIVACLSASPVV